MKNLTDWKFSTFKSGSAEGNAGDDSELLLPTGFQLNDGKVIGPNDRKAEPSSESDSEDEVLLPMNVNPKQ